MRVALPIGGLEDPHLSGRRHGRDVAGLHEPNETPPLLV